MSIQQKSIKSKSLHERLGLFLVRLPLSVADTDPYAADFRVVNGTRESAVATVVNYGAVHEITEENRESDCEYQDRSINEGKSLARLFAAGPEMYEALECVLNSDMAQREEDEGRKSKTLSLVRAALAKARGEQPE
jgi:hypothetical protein